LGGRRIITKKTPALPAHAGHGPRGAGEAVAVRVLAIRQPVAVVVLPVGAALRAGDAPAVAAVRPRVRTSVGPPAPAHVVDAGVAGGAVRSGLAGEFEIADAGTGTGDHRGQDGRGKDETEPHRLESRSEADPDVHAQPADPGTGAGGLLRLDEPQHGPGRP